MRSVLGLFGRSPFKPLADHADRVHETVVLVPALVEAFMDDQWEETQAIYERISKPAAAAVGALLFLVVRFNLV